MLPHKNQTRMSINPELSDQKRSDLGEQFARLQRRLNKMKRSLLIIVDGWESSGKGFLLKDLTRELDPKYYEVSVFEEATTEESNRSYLYRFFDKAPHHGQIAFFDRSFYYNLFSRTDLSKTQLDHYIDDISFVEEALANDDTLVVKFFLHQTQEEMQIAIENLEVDPFRHVRLAEMDYSQLNNYDAYFDNFEEILTQTNFEFSPWHILYTQDQEDTSRLALDICISELETFLDAELERKEPELEPLPPSEELPLNQIDLSKSITQEEYDEQKEALQKEAGDLLYQAYIENKPIIIAYEGTDAAGKGGNIERLTRYMDPRGYDVATISGPNETEAKYHYLWRFYQEFPANGRMTIFDRSWYGRVLVERIENLTPAYRWKEAYDEINQMEHNLVHQGALLLKYLILIDKDEQLERFQARAEDPDKQHKLTDEDWRNHQQFDVYKEAMNEMVIRTSTDSAPWTLISGTDKQYARIFVLKDFIKRMKEYLAIDA